MKEAWNILSNPATLRSTPTTPNASSTKSSTRTSLRPPIFNPYDRFTQPEFESWIGDITSSIKRALRHEVEPEVEHPSGRNSCWKTLQDQVGGSLTTEKRAQSPTFTEPHDEESILEDSFAQIASRKAKGKARDPREGPGLGLKDQPIELLSDSEEEEVAENLEEEAVLSETSDDGAWEGSFEETGSGLVESGKAEPRQSGASVRRSASLLSREDSGHVQEVADYSDADALDTGDEDDLQLPEGSFCEGDVGVDSRIEGFSMQRGDSEDDSLHLSQSAAPINVELVDPWDGPRTFAEDYYSGGDRLAPGLTPNHLTPVARSPVPTSAVNFPPKPSTDANADSRPVSPSVSSAFSTPKSRNTVDVARVKAASSQRSIVPATFVNSEQDELEAESYYDHLDVTGHAVKGAEGKEVESAEVASFVGARPVRKKDLMSGAPRSDQRRDMVLVPFSDDEHTDVDGEDDEGRFSAIPPLGTSDLDIGDDWGTTGRYEGVNDTSDGDEEDEIQEVVPTQTTDGVAKTAALTPTQFSEVVNTDGLNGPKVAIADPSTPTLAQTFQLTDAESFGDLPMSSPPSESPSPAADGHAEELQPSSIEQLFAVLERELFEGSSQTPKPSTLLARESEAESTHNWTYQELEKILSEELSATENAGVAPMEDMASQEVFSAQRSEYVVEENGPETVLSVEGSDDARSIPLDMPEAVETIQQYEVEEPEADVRSTEDPEFGIQVSNNEDTSITVPQTQLVVSSPESPSTPVLEYPALSPSALRTEETSQAGLSSAAVIIPAPIVADPSVPDPVPGDSSPTSPVPIDSFIAPRLSIVPSLTASDLEPSQISIGISGLFTPAQRSGVGTPVLLEDETAEALRTPDNESNNGSLAGSTLPADKRLTAGEEGEDNAVDKNLVMPNNPIKVLAPPSPNAHQLGPAVDVDAKDPKPDTVETDDDISSTPRGGSVEPAVSPPSLTGDTPGASLKNSDRPDVLASGGDPHTGTDIAEGDEDADGEADPDYAPEGGVAEGVTVGIDVASNEASNDSHNRAGTVPDPVRSPIRTEEPQAIWASSSSHTSPALQDNSSAQGNGIPGSDVKATDEGKKPTQALKRKRRYPHPGSTRITRSQSGSKAGSGKKKGPSSRRRGASRKSKLEQVDPSVDSADEDASEVASVSSGASAVYRLLRPSSRAGSAISSGSGDAPWASPLPSRVVPLVHSHGLLLHHHGRPAPPPLALPLPPAGPPKDPRPDQAKAKSPAPTSEPSTPTLRRTLSMNSPVTRSNCRFHKISLPQGESGQRAHFVVPGCALGDYELMIKEDIKDEGLSTHENHKCMLPNVETLDLDPYLVGVLRQLVGVDLLREQQEIFYLPSEKEEPRRRRQTDAVEILRQLRRQSASSGGPLAREHSPRLLDDWKVRATPPRSASGSVRSGADSRSHSEARDSDLSDLSNDDEPEPKRHRRLAMKEMKSLPLENASADGILGDAPPTLDRDAPAEKEQTHSSRSPITRSKRKPLHPDAAAYKPGEGDDEDEAVVDTRRKKSGPRKSTKRSRTMEDASASTPRSKKSRLGRSVSVADAGAVDS